MIGFLVSAEAAEKKIYNLENLEVEGEVRRPLVNMIERDVDRQNQINRLAEYSFSQMENNLTQPLSLEELHILTNSKEDLK